MIEFNFEFKTVGGYNVYRIELAELQVISTRRKWIHDLDIDFINDEKEQQDYLDENVDKSDQSVKVTTRESILAQVLQLQEQLKKLEQQEEDEKPKKVKKSKKVDSVNTVFCKALAEFEDDV